jgi:hypothetical protein
MTLGQITLALSTIIKGRITKGHYKTTQGDYTKETATCVRFVEYSHINGVQPKGKGNPNETHTIKNMLIYNKNTNKHYLQMATVKKAKPKVRYFYKGQEIDKATYDMANPPRANAQPLVVFKKDIADIISIG